MDISYTISALYDFIDFIDVFHFAVSHLVSRVCYVIKVEGSEGRRKVSPSCFGFFSFFLFLLFISKFSLYVFQPTAIEIFF